jgi:hypothetical protein
VHRVNALIYTQDVPELVGSLIQLLGIGRVRKAVQSWNKSIQSSRGLVKEYFARNSFRWWPAFKDYWDAERKQVADFPLSVIALAKDARKLFDLLPEMPASVRKKFAHALSSRENSPSHVFEISIAWHFWKQGHSIQWFKDGEGPIPEFLVKTPTFEFEVECKQIGVDSSRSVSRLDFCRLAQEIVDAAKAQKVMGQIDVVLNRPLSSAYRRFKRWLRILQWSPRSARLQRVSIGVPSS